MDWSTSYMASASSSHSHSTLSIMAEDSSTFEESADEDSVLSRDHRVDDDSGYVAKENAPTTRRSVSPVVTRRSIDQKNGSSLIYSAQNVISRHSRSPSAFRQIFSHSPHPVHKKMIHLLPKYYTLHTFIPRFSTQIDTRKLLEHVILFSAILTALLRYSLLPNAVSEFWIIRELGILTLLSALYMMATRTRFIPPIVPPHIEHGHRRHPPVPLPKLENKNPSLLWMTSSRDYRTDADDGVLTALLLGPVTTAAMLYGTLYTEITGADLYPPGWVLEPPFTLSKSLWNMPAREALLSSRRNLVQLSTLCSFVLLVHLCTSNFAPASHIIPNANSEPKISSGDHSERKMRRGRRSWNFIGYTFLISTVAVIFHVLGDSLGLEIWKDLSYFDVGLVSLFYQFAVYVMIRLSHGGFTLGEVGLVALGSTVLFMDTVNMTVAKIWPVTTTFIKTTRYPTPILIYQLALLPGSFLIGLLLSPLLVLSRHTSQLPAHRLKQPHDQRLKQPRQREIQRRALAFSFYFFSLLIIFGLIGFWTQWCLGGRNPWIWAVLWLTQGSTSWVRPALLCYWAVLGSFTVGTWGRILARSRRYQRNNTIVMNGPRQTMHTEPALHDNQMPPPSPSLTHVATDLLDAADKRVPTLGLNGRRKSFHALATFMFLPGIIFDPAFTHFCLSAAFALFVFAEYIRYFALYPFGRFIHIFLNEFVDSKDNGSAILSHFYLLTGVANSLWFEGPWRLLEFTGVLSLGVGDAMASIVGRRIGRLRWTEGNPKTVEGSFAFFASVVVCTLLLRSLGIVEPFSVARYIVVVGMGCALEAVSNQNDNLTIPLYLWSMTVLLEVCRLR
ncbi:hypothetical protein CPB86DRAFT_747729 [Serendipita vermifera]|nr:hypothetical protein CPB86DRAFT_747729 [Serendipita vermifera]